MTKEDLLENVLEDFLLTCVCHKVEEVSELPKMLNGINYLNNKESLISHMTEGEILDVSSYGILYSTEYAGKIHINYEMSYMLLPLI